MADLARRMVGPVALSNTTTALYTVPAGTTAILRNIHALNTNNVSIYTFNLGLTSAATAANCFFYLTPVPSGGAMDWSGFLVLNAGDILHGLGSSANAITLTISGIEAS